MRLLCGAIVVLVQICPGSLVGQVLTGTVRDISDQRPVRASEIALVEAGVVVGRALSGEDGFFRLTAPYPGAFRLNVTSLGYNTLVVEALQLHPGQETTVEIQLSADPITLPGFTVLERRDRGRGLISDYYYRLDMVKKTGRGLVLDREFLAERDGQEIATLLSRQPNLAVARDHDRVERVFIRRNGKLCRPAFYLNGLPADPDVVQMSSAEVEGVEVYRGYNDFEYGGSCGTILVWTRQDWEPQPDVAGQREIQPLVALLATTAFALATVIMLF